MIVNAAKFKETHKMIKKTTTLAFTFLMAVAPLFASNGKKNSNPNTSDNFSISKTADDIYVLEVQSEGSGFVKVKIIGGISNLIHEKTISYDGNVKVPFNLSELEEGNYTFALEGPDIKGTQKVFLSKMHQEDVAVFVEDLGNDKAKVTVFHDDVPVNISLVNGKGNKYFERSLKLTNNFVQVFDLSDVKEENMTVVVKGRKSSIAKSL